MKINISKKEYRSLVEMLFIAEWVINSMHVDPPYKEHVNFIQKIYALYKEMDAEDIIEYSNEHDEYFELGSFDEDMQIKFLAPYENEIFWEGLINRLSMRDILNEVDKKEYEEMDNATRLALLAQKRHHYEMEFDKHDLDRIRIEEVVGLAKKNLSSAK